LSIQAVGLTYTSAIHTGWIIGFIPVVIALGAHFVMRQRMSPLGWWGVAVATGGVLVVTMKAPPDFSRAKLGDGLQVLSCVTWAVYTLGATGVVRRNGAMGVTTVVMAVAAGVLVAVAAASGSEIALMARVSGRVIWATAFLGVFCSGMAYVLWTQTVEEVGATRAGAVLYLEPFFAMGVAVVTVGEVVTWHVLVGGGLVLWGVGLVGRGTRMAPGGAD
jgi:drug/metabolite transporter (DMT)-like permease